MAMCEEYRKLVLAAVLWAAMAAAQAQEAQAQARAGAVADGVSAVVGLGAGVPVNPLLPVLGVAFKAATFRRAESLPETERPRAYALAAASWQGSAAGNACAAVSVLSGGAFLPACVAVGVAWGWKTWKASERERRDAERCAALRRAARSFPQAEAALRLHEAPHRAARPAGPVHAARADLRGRPGPRCAVSAGGDNRGMSDCPGLPDIRFGTLVAGQNRALQLALAGAPLEQILTLLVQAAEAQSDHGFMGSILLLDEDGRHLRHGAAPSLPQAYRKAIDGAEIGPCAGSCGTAAYFGHAIVVPDIERDPLWADYRELALAHGLRACWSTPFVAKDRSVLGTLALYYREARSPSEDDRAIVKLVGSTAAVIIENARLHARLKDLNHRARLAADAGNLGFFTWEIESDTVSWQNDRPYGIFGISPADGPINARRFVAEFLHPEDQQAFAAAVSEALEGGRVFHFEGRIVRKPDGAIRRVEFTGQLDAEARAKGLSRVVGIAADVTARRPG